jgi:hypothetical protein
MLVPPDNRSGIVRVYRGAYYPPGDEEGISVRKQRLNGPARLFQFLGGTLEITVVNRQKEATPV